MRPDKLEFRPHRRRTVRTHRDASTVPLRKLFLTLGPRTAEQAIVNRELANGEVDGCLVDAEHPDRDAAASHITELRDRYASLAIIAFLDSSQSGEYFGLGGLGVDGVVTSTTPRTRLRDDVDDAFSTARGDRIASAMEHRFPAPGPASVAWAVARAGHQTSVEKLAAAQGHTPRGLRDALRAIGPVRHIVAPNKFHHLFVKAWIERFPDATSWADPSLAQRRTELRFDHTLGDQAETAWKGEIDQLSFGGSRVLSEMVFHHAASRTLVLTDIVQNHDPKLDHAFWRWLKRVNRIVAPGGEAPLDWRLTVRNREVARAALDRLLAWDFDRVILSHGICIETGGRAFVENAFRWLG